MSPSRDGGGEVREGEKTMPIDETAEQLWRDPDWICPVCEYTNLAIRERCRNCGFDSALVSGDSYFPVEGSYA